MRIYIAIGGLLLGLISPTSASAQSCTWAKGWIAAENAKAGNPNWSKEIPLRVSADFSRRKDVDRTEGYFDRTSATCGSRATLSIIHPGKNPVVISAYRTGYYKGDGARLISRTTTDEKTWSVTVDQRFTPGQYLFALSSKGERPTFVPLVIRGDVSRSLTFISSVLTWQSYNQWGGKSLYKGEDAKRESKASLVTFNRPYDGDGSGQFRYMEFPVTSLIEKAGIDVEYLTDLDVTDDALNKTNTIILGGHSEYWTATEHQAIRAAIDKGVNLINFGGNGGYARVSYKNRKIGAITKWRDIGLPESEYLGSQYFALGVHRDMVIKNERWPFDSIAPVTTLKGVYGYEVDTAINTPGPAVEVIAQMAILPTERRIAATSTYYIRESGSGILNMATNGWTCAIDDVCPWGHRFDRNTQRLLKVVTTEVLKESARGPLGKTHPAMTTIPARK